MLLRSTRPTMRSTSDGRSALVELPVAGDVVVRGPRRCYVLDRVVGPLSVKFSVVDVRRPRPLMVRVGAHQVPRVGHGDPSQYEQGLDGRIGGAFGEHQALDVRHARARPDDHAPHPIPFRDQVKLQALDGRAQSRDHFRGDQEDDGPPVLDRGTLDARENVPEAGHLVRSALGDRAARGVVDEFPRGLLGPHVERERDHELDRGPAEIACGERRGLLGPERAAGGVHDAVAPHLV